MKIYLKIGIHEPVFNIRQTHDSSERLFLLHSVERHAELTYSAGTQIHTYQRARSGKNWLVLRKAGLTERAT